MTYLPMPSPVPYPESEGFWEGCKKHKLMFQKCTDCDTYRHPPIPVCPVCQSWHVKWTEVSGKGRVEGFTIVTRPLFPGLPVPYNVVRVEIEEQKGLLILGNVIDCPPEEIVIDMRVKVTFEDVDPKCTMYYFEKFSSQESQ